MATELKSIENIFPLIDDPMNIFYSKIKQWFRLNSNFHLHCKATSRIDRIVECTFNGISRTYKCKFKTSKFLKEEDIGHNLYVYFTFIESSKDTGEMTTSGESIPVDISNLYLREDTPKPVVLHDHNEIILYRIGGNTLDNRTLYYVYLRVGKVYKTDYSYLDIENTERDYKELTFNDAYHQSIGRLWVLKERSVTTHYSVLDDSYEWRLYNIDSENNYTLIDQYGTTPQTFGATILWPVQYGPGLDHRTNFTYTYGTGDTHPLMDIASSEHWYEIRESDFSLSENDLSICGLWEEADPFLNTRGTVPSFLPNLFSGLHLDRRYRPYYTPFHAEGFLLLLSYICNMNPRYILCASRSKPLNEVVNPPNNSNIGPSYLLEWIDSKYSMSNICSVNIDLADGYVNYTLNTSLQSTAPNYDKVQAAYNNMTPQGSHYYIEQNSLPHPIFPNVKWYLHQWVYALSFKKYIPITVTSSSGSINYEGESLDCDYISSSLLVNNLLP